MRVEAGRGRTGALGARASRPPRGRLEARSGDGSYPWLWILPALALVLLFTLYPVAHTLWTSLHRVMILLPGEPFVGLANYQAVLESALSSGRYYDGRYVWIDSRINLETGILPKKDRAVENRKRALESIIKNLTKQLTT